LVLLRQRRQRGEGETMSAEAEALLRKYKLHQLAEMERELPALIQQYRELMSTDPGELLLRIAKVHGPDSDAVIKVAKVMVDDLVDEVAALRQDTLRKARECGCVIIGGSIRRNPPLPPSRRGGW
jgi:hypothetical protein